MLNELRGRVEKLSENFNNDIGNIKMEVENIKTNQLEMKYTLTEMKTTLQGINSREDEAEDPIWKIRKQKIPTRTAKRKKISQNEDSVRSLRNNFKCTNICLMGVPEGEKREQEIEKLFEKMITR